MSTDSEEILHDTVNRRDPLELNDRLETPHLALPLTRRVVGDLGSIVRVLIRDVDHGRHHGAARGGGGAPLVGDQSSRETARGFQQRPKESDGCSPISGSYNFIRPHRALTFGRETRTPAMQAGLVNAPMNWSDIFTAPAALYAFHVAVVRVPGAVQLMHTSPAALSSFSWPHEHRSAA